MNRNVTFVAVSLPHPQKYVQGQFFNLQTFEKQQINTIEI